MDICFENKEADIGRFLRRHLGGADIKSILASFGIPLARSAPAHNWHQELCARRSNYLDRQQKRLGQLGVATEESYLLRIGRWDVTAAFSEVSGLSVADDAFLNTIMSSNHRYLG